MTKNMTKNISNPYLDLFEALQELQIEVRKLRQELRTNQLDGYMSTETFKNEFGYTVESQNRLRSEGLLPYSRVNGTGKVVYKRSEVYKWMEKNK